MLRSPWLAVIQGLSGTSVFARIKDVPPERHVKLKPATDPYIAPITLSRKGRGVWAANEDLWAYLYTQSCAKVLADARSHAVPTDDVDVKAREAKLAHLMQVGLLGLNMVSMFVPVLGEVMMVVMAGQLLYEILEGAIEWSEGDRRAAKDHLIDVAENLAQIALMAGVGAGVRKISSASAVPAIEKLHPVMLPNGETRLWKSDLKAYESAVTLPVSPGPNSAGQHVLEVEPISARAVRSTSSFSINRSANGASGIRPTSTPGSRCSTAMAAVPGGIRWSVRGIGIV